MGARGEKKKRERERDGTLAKFGEKPIPPRWIDRFRVIAIGEFELSRLEKG